MSAISYDKELSREHVRDYVTLSDCYDILNARLFGGELRGCVLTFEDHGKSNFGYFKKGGFVGREGEGNRDEICLNPRHFLTNTGDLELLQTLAHEMCHQWQYQCGKPSPGYHNKEWAAKMLSIGLTPSENGRPGGRMIGQTMADYPTEGGPFLAVATEILAAKTLIRWYKQSVVLRKVEELTTSPDGEALPAVADMAASLASDGVALKPARAPSKLAYMCPKCRAKVWGKPNLSLICGACHAGDAVIVHLECNAA